MTISAPAKINLTLEVLGVRPDGYHKIRSVMQTVTLCDILHFSSSPETSIKSTSTAWDAGKSLVAHATALLRQETGDTRGAAITVEKHIPLTSGLGGDSSDATATMVGLNRMWQLGLSRGRLAELAAQLGADVTFFLYGGTARAEGKGEKVTPLPPLSHHFVLLVVPDVPRPPGKTAQLYASLKRNHYTDGHITEKAIEKLNNRRPPHLFNTFENVAFTKESRLTTYRNHLLKMGAREVHLCGSGPALFTLIKDRSEAEELYTRCQNQGMEAYLVETRDREFD
ncbi:4-(cytidine 5'-diphospho)-2-C-methyl-D-erythritol kinase [Chloroflexota bacterium]